jgi:hypothetical protein
MCSLYIIDRLWVGLAYVCFVAGFTLLFVDAAFVVDGCCFTEPSPGLLYFICAFEGYFDVCLFVKFGDFSEFIAVVCDGSPFLGFVDGIVGVWFCCVCLFSLVMSWTGKSLFFAMVRIFCHSPFLFLM